MNFLEQLAAEWYAYQGFFVCTNVRFARRAQGGYAGEMDVVAFDPKDKTLIHVETCGDAQSWEQRRQQFQRKFGTAEKHYRATFNFGIRRVRKIAIAGFGKRRKALALGPGIELLSVEKLVRQIVEEVAKSAPTQRVVPEKFPLLRAIQLGNWYG